MNVKRCLIAILIGAAIGYCLSQVFAYEDARGSTVFEAETAGWDVAELETYCRTHTHSAEGQPTLEECGEWLPITATLPGEEEKLINELEQGEAEYEREHPEPPEAAAPVVVAQQSIGTPVIIVHKPTKHHACTRHHKHGKRRCHHKTHRVDKRLGA